jgi:hypothetical protein
MRLPLPVKAPYAIGVLRDASEKIDHSLPPAQPVPQGVTAAHGAYVANGCIGCHGPKLAGGKIAGGVTRGAARRQAHTRSRQRPRAVCDGRAVDGDAEERPASRRQQREQGQPFGSLKEMNEVNVRALYLHLRSLPASS